MRMYCNLCKLGTHKKKIVDLTNYKMIIDHDQVLLTKVQLHALTQNVGLPGCLYIYISDCHDYGLCHDYDQYYCR